MLLARNLQRVSMSTQMTANFIIEWVLKALELVLGILMTIEGLFQIK